MTSVGTGVGNNVGGQATPLPRDLEATAAAETAKASLAIVHDSIEKAFTDMNPRYSTGYLGGFGYKTTAGNPLLGHPLENVRIAQSFDQATDKSWQLIYQELIKQLPPSLLTRFTLDGNKPFEQRNTSFVALDNLLLTAAKILTQTKALAENSEINSLEEERTLRNTLLPFAALKGSIEIGNEVIQASKSFLSSQGANYRHFDGFNNILSQMQGAISLMDRVNNSLSNTINGQLSPQAILLAGKATHQLTTLASEIEKISLGHDLQLLLSTINALTSVSTALSLTNTLTAPLSLALSLSSIGLYTSQSPLGMIGPSLENLINNLSQGIIAGTLPLNNRASNDFFTLIVTSSLAVFIGLASLTVTSGLGIYPQKDQYGTDAAHFFVFEAAVALAANSGFLETFYKEAIAISGGNTEAQTLGSSVLAKAATLLIILSGSIAARQSPLRLIENEADYLNTGIKTAQNIENNTENEQTAATAIALQLGSIALQSHDYEGFLEALHNFLESQGITQDALKADIANINQIAEQIAGLSKKDDLDTHLTGIINII